MDRILRFVVVGGWGFVINTAVLIFGVRFGMRPSIAAPVGAEIAIISNFLLNNFWTFSDRKITDWAILPVKFLQFNLLSLGSTLIQFTFLRVGEVVFGLTKFKTPIVSYDFYKKLPVFPQITDLPVVKTIALKVSAYMIVYCFAVGVGMVVNFAIYSLIIWK